MDDFDWLSDIKRDWDAGAGRERPAPASPATVDEPERWRVQVCLGNACRRDGSRALLRHLESRVRREGLDGAVEVEIVGCRDRCDDAPSMNVYPGPTLYNRLDRGALNEIVDRHLAGGEPVRALEYRPASRRRRR